MTVLFTAGGDAGVEAGECAMPIEDAVEIAEVDTTLAVSSTSIILSMVPVEPSTDPVCGGGDETVVFTMVVDCETVEGKAVDERGAEADDNELAIESNGLDTLSEEALASSFIPIVLSPGPSFSQRSPVATGVLSLLPYWSGF